MNKVTSIEFREYSKGKWFYCLNYGPGTQIFTLDGGNYTYTQNKARNYTNGNAPEFYYPLYAK